MYTLQDKLDDIELSIMRVKEMLHDVGVDAINEEMYDYDLADDYEKAIDVVYYQYERNIVEEITRELDELIEERRKLRIALKGVNNALNTF